jgi:uncharacterized protein (TIGR02001 family)
MVELTNHQLNTRFESSSNNCKALRLADLHIGARLKYVIYNSCCTFVTILLLCCSPAYANPTIGGSVSWTSDYVLRGVSQSQNLPAIQADLHIQPNPLWVAGLWASTVHVRPYTNSTELDVYLGRHWNINQDWMVNTVVTHYQYLNDPRATSYDYDELALTAQWADSLAAKVTWSPNTSVYDYYGYIHSDQQIMTTELAYHLPLPYQLKFEAGVGVYVPLQTGNGRYVYASSTLSRRFGQFAVDLQYFWVQSMRHRTYNPGPRAIPWALTAHWNF